MASQIDFSRLRKQNLFPEIVDIGSNGIGGIDLSDMPEFNADPGGYITEGPEQAPDNYQFGQYNIPDVEFGREPSDPRTPVNPTIAGPAVYNDPHEPVAGPGSKGASTAQELEEIINRIFTPETTSRDRYNRLLDAAPEREGPGVMRGLAAFGMGLQAKDPESALNVHERVMFAPHHRNMADWTAKTGPFGNAAQYENTANVNERTLAGNMATAVVNQNRYDQQNAINEEKNRIAEYKAESERILRNAQAYMQRLGHGWTPVTTGPTVIMVNKDTNETMDTGMSTGKMTEEAKITLENLGKVQTATALGQNQMNVQGLRNQGALAVQTLRNQRVTGNGGTRGLLPSQQKDALFNKAQQWVLQHPEDKPFITFDAGGTFDVDEPSTSMFGNPKGMPPDRYDAFISTLYGGDSAMPGSATPSGMPTPPAAPAMPRGAGPAVGGQPQQQGQYDFSMPSNIDPRGRDPNQHPELQQGPGIMQQYPAQPLVTPQMRDPSQPTPEQQQAMVQIEQQIKTLEAQLAASGAPPVPNEGSINSGDQSIVGQRFRQNQGMPPAPTNFPFSLPQGTPQGSISDRSAAMTTGQAAQQGVQAQQIKQAQQQQIQAKIAELRQQQEQILTTPPPAPQMVRVRMPDGQTGTVPASMVPNLPRGAQVIQ